MKISLVVPVRDEERSVEALLSSIAGQTRLPDEVVVVDAGSRDKTATLVRAFRMPAPLVLLARGPLYPGEARNEGAATAAEDWIAFTDAGIRLAPEWLEELACQVGDHDVALGSYEPVCDTFFRECAALAYVAPRDESGWRGPVVASMLLRRTAFREAGGFPEFRAAEDLIFFERLERAQVSTVRVPGAVARWETAGTPVATFRRFALYSEHNLRAERGRFWHVGLLKLYGVLMAALTGALLGGGILALLGLPMFWIVRALKAAVQKRRSLDFAVFHPGRIIVAAMILVVTDAATLVGWWRWMWSRAGR